MKIDRTAVSRGQFFYGSEVSDKNTVCPKCGKKALKEGTCGKYTSFYCARCGYGHDDIPF